VNKQERTTRSCGTYHSEVNVSVARLNIDALARELG
jgi:hypothetical protein